MLIVGTDFSTPAAMALAEARALAGELRLGVAVVHVRPGHDTGMWEPDTSAKAWLRIASVRGDELMVIRRGTPWVELVRIAREQRARMIVVGTHGRSGFQPISLGSTASRLALLAPLPVVLVGQRERPPIEGPADEAELTQELDITGEQK